MRIDTARTAQVRAYATRQSKADSAAKVAANSTGAVEQPSASVSIAGIPESELTPRVHDAIQRLIDEVSRLQQDLMAKERRISELEKLADEDPLTGLFNRRAFVREVTRYVNFATRYDAPSTILFFDINGMKTINDSLGHLAGDEALRHFADTVRQHVRRSDILGRLGGDEFGILLVNTDEKAASARGQAIVDALRASPAQWRNAAIPVTTAWGLHPISSDMDVNDALHAADVEMYANKSASR